MTGSLQVLALTNSLRNDDFPNFRRIALGFLDQYGKGGLVLISDRKGKILFSSATEDTASLPPRSNMAIVEKLFATKAPQYSDLFTGALQPSAGSHRRGSGVPQRRGGLRPLLQPADQHLPESRREAAARPGMDGIPARRQRHRVRARAEPRRNLRQARVAFTLRGNVPRARGSPLVDLARRRSAGLRLYAIAAHGLDRRRRRPGKLADRAALAQHRDHQPDRRRAAADRPDLCGQDGDHDCARRDAAQSADRGAQPSRQEHAGADAGDRGADVSQRQPRRADQVRGAPRRARRGT